MPLANRGAAMLAALLFLVLASGIVALMFTSTLSEIRHSSDDVAIVQALTLARGGANMGARLLHDAVRDELQILTLQQASTVERFPFGSSLNITDPEPTVSTVVRDLGTLTAALQKRVDTLLCNAQLTPVSAEKLSIKVYFTDTACKEPLPSIIELPAGRYISGKVRTYAVPFVLVASARVGANYERSIATQGEYQFTLGGGKFSQYALFTDEQLGLTGKKTWFTSETNYDGRVHTNGTFNIAFEPWFGDKVTSVGCTSRAQVRNVTGKWTTECRAYNPGASFYSEGLRSFRKASDISIPPKYGSDAPIFTQSVDWRADYIPLPEDDLDQKHAADTAGLVITGDQDSLTLYAGDANGNPLRQTNGGWTPQASYQYIEVCKIAAPCQLYRYGADNNLYKQNTDGSWPLDSKSAVRKDFNGVVYVEGEVARLKGPDRVPADSDNPDHTPPALATFATVTVVPKNGARITGDLKYERPPCSGVLSRANDGTVSSPPCNNLNTKNILGVYSPEGDIKIGNNNADTSLNAPKNLTIHGSFMTAKGVFMTENLGSSLARGDINVLGGVIQKRDGSIGKFDSSGKRFDGYGLNITFDRRMALDYAPPYFPGTEPSEVQGIFVYSFGQREQVF